MAAASGFERNVFINCPFDEDFRPILEAILFCVIDSDLTPLVATERVDSGEARLEKIVELILSSRWSIHDLSRVRASEEGEFARLNMPFELGVDHGTAKAGTPPLTSKRLLVIAEDRYLYQRALSDIAGWDIRSHRGDVHEAIDQVRHWLRSHNLVQRSTSQISGGYVNYLEWDYERLLADGWSDDDIKGRETPELMDAMTLWRDVGRPETFT